MQPATGCTIQSRSPHNTNGSCDFNAECGYAYDGYWATHSGKYYAYGSYIPGSRTSGKLFVGGRLEECFQYIRVSGIFMSESASGGDYNINFRLVFLTYETEFVLFLAVLENSVLPMG